MFYISLENDLKFVSSNDFTDSVRNALTELAETHWDIHQSGVCAPEQEEIFITTFKSENEAIWTRSASAIAKLGHQIDACRDLWLQFSNADAERDREKIAIRYDSSPPDLIQPICRQLSKDQSSKVRLALCAELLKTGTLDLLPLIVDAEKSEPDFEIRLKWKEARKSISRSYVPQKSADLFDWKGFQDILLEDCMTLLSTFFKERPSVNARAIFFDCNPEYGQVLVTVAQDEDIEGPPENWNCADCEHFDIAYDLGENGEEGHFANWQIIENQISDLMSSEFADDEDPDEDFMTMAAAAAARLEQSDLLKEKTTDCIVVAISHDEDINAALERRNAHDQASVIGLGNLLKRIVKFKR